MKHFISAYKVKTGLIISYIISFVYCLSGWLQGMMKAFFWRHIIMTFVLFGLWLLCGYFTRKTTNLTLKNLFRSRGVLKFYLITELLVLITTYMVLVKEIGIKEFSSSYEKKVFHVILVNVHFFGFLVSSLMLFLYQALTALKQKETIAVENEKLEKENAKAKFEALKQHLNPHFLFNSLGALKAMVSNNSPQAENYIIHLSNVYRYLVTHKSHDTVFLKDETEFIQSYLYLLKIRYEDNMRVTFAVDNKYLYYKLAPLTLQLLLENAVKHNVISQASPLHITISTQNDTLIVSNTLQPRIATEGSSNFGLYNLSQQYKFLTGKEIDINRTTEFSVTIPLIAGNQPQEIN